MCEISSSYMFKYYLKSTTPAFPNKDLDKRIDYMITIDNHYIVNCTYLYCVTHLTYVKFV